MIVKTAFIITPKTVNQVMARRWPGDGQAMPEGERNTFLYSKLAVSFA